MMALRRRNTGCDRLSEVTQYGPVGSTSSSVDQMTRVSRPRLLVKLLALGSDNISGQERDRPNSGFESAVCRPEGIRIESWCATCPMEGCCAGLPRGRLEVVPTILT
ncbi:hypothetical protein CK203_116724 [Vitis vinifera]|uniref:Uncharacterized protein n=1 Tax=Vitis vinifera TaxID=29760 RepID=A0A438CQR3_VITVI|nr:hypothetical protein CK203_116724 [Vitis vinifera]